MADLDKIRVIKNGVTTDYEIGGSGGTPSEVELGMLLWENPNPTQAFSDQTITLSSDNYDYIVVDFIRRLADNPVYHISFRYEKQCGAFSIAKYDNGNTICDRQINYIDDTHYRIMGCYTNSTLVNSNLIPFRIFGYKNTIPAVVQKESEVYSTTEQVIGQWINGKPLYRKVIQTTLPTVADSWVNVYNNAAENIDTLVKCNGVITQNDHLIPTPFAEGGSYYVNAYVDKSTFALMLLKHAVETNPITVILEYTKTTDTVGGAE